MSNTTDSPEVQKVNFVTYKHQDPSPESFNYASSLCKEEFGGIGQVIITTNTTSNVINYLNSHPDQSLIELRRAFHMAANLTARYKDLKSDYDKLSVSFHDLQYEHNCSISQHEAEMQGAKKMLSGLDLSNAAKRKELSRPHADPKFTGTDMKLLTPFIRDLRQKLEVNADWWDTERLRMIYVASCFPPGSIAKKTIDSGFKMNGQITYKSVEDIIDLLKQSFGDADETATAQRELKMCHQKNQTLALFLPNWLASAEISGFNDSALISYLKDALHPDILNRISFIRKSDIPQTLSQYVAVVREQDEILRSLNPKYHLTNFRKALDHTVTSNSPAIHHLPASPLIPSTDITTAHGGDAMDLSSIQVNNLQLITKWTAKDVGRKPVNDLEKAHRRAYNALNNLCIVCDSKDHSSRECPSSFHNRSKKKGEKLNNVVIAEDGKGKDDLGVTGSGNA